MTPNVSDAVLDRFGREIGGRFGLYFPKNRRNDLARILLESSLEFGFNDPEACVDWLMAAPMNPKQIEILTGHLTVGETYFFRDTLVFEALEQRILPELIASRRSSNRCLRIWSAACSTGEEAYSIAILLTRLLPDWRAWNITILATDINPRALLKAAEGVYTQWSFRNAPPWLLEHYVRKTPEGRYQVIPEIRRMVSFANHNLVRDSFGSVANNTNAMDIIFCRNVLMYFSRDTAADVIDKFYQSAAEGGWLAVGASEIPLTVAPGFEQVNLTGQTFFRRQVGSMRTTPLSRVPPNAHSGVEGQGDGEKPSGDSSFPPVLLQRPADHNVVEIGRPIAESYDVNWNDQQWLSTTAGESCNSHRSFQPTSEPADFGQRSGAYCSHHHVPGTPVAENREQQVYQDAMALYRQGLYAEATRRLEPMQSARAFALSARSQANLGRLNEALRWTDKAVGTDKLNPHYHYLRASILQELQRIEDAMAALRQTLYLDPSFVLAHIALGHLCNKLGKLEEARRHFANAQAELHRYPQHAVQPESENLGAGRMTEIIEAV